MAKDYKYKVFLADRKGGWGKDEKFKKVRPLESKEFFLNPHKGIATFQNFNGDPLFKDTFWTEKGPAPAEADMKKKTPTFVKGYAPSTVSYCRWYWQTIEPKEGRFRWDIIENALKCAEIRGQSLEVRLMAFGELDTPEWFQQYCPNLTKEKANNPPDHDHPLFFKYWSRVISEFAKRFGNHPNLDTFDIAVVGPWGEGDGKIKKETMEKFINFYIAELPRHKIIVNSDGYQMVYGSCFDIGWRGDCFGDMRMSAPGAVPNGTCWNHMYDMYPKVVCEANATDNWKRAPVLLETCWNPAWWYKNGMPEEYLDFCHEQYYKYHASVFMPKYSELPAKWMPKFMELAKKLGYRFVFRQFFYDRKLKGNWFQYQAWIENVGVAPMYRDLYDLAFRFTQGKKQCIVNSIQDIRRWLPGDVWITEDITLPVSFDRGEVKIDVALVDKKTKKPKVFFANKGYTKDAWLPLDTIEVDK